MQRPSNERCACLPLHNKIGWISLTTVEIVIRSEVPDEPGIRFLQHVSYSYGFMLVMLILMMCRLRIADADRM
jgi:hypothetical protein